jgi:hypothetical protein
MQAPNAMQELRPLSAATTKGAMNYAGFVKLTASVLPSKWNRNIVALALKDREHAVVPNSGSDATVYASHRT